MPFQSELNLFATPVCQFERSRELIKPLDCARGDIYFLFITFTLLLYTFATFKLCNYFFPTDNKFANNLYAPETPAGNSLKKLKPV